METKTLQIDEGKFSSLKYWTLKDVDKNEPSLCFSLVEIAFLLGPDEGVFLSQGDKSRVPIGITAANKEAPLC